MGKNLVSAGLACLSLAVFVGCGGPSLPTIPVSGNVTVDGNPMEGVTVVFAPASGSSGRGASGQTDAEGNFKLTTEVAGDGALAGDYTVSVSKTEVDADTLPKEVDPNDPASMDDIYGNLDTSKTQKAKTFIAKKWSSGQTSGLKATVAEGSENNFTFEVTSK